MRFPCTKDLSRACQYVIVTTTVVTDRKETIHLNLFSVALLYY
jgi:hypothetical protein